MNFASYQIFSAMFGWFFHLSGLVKIIYYGSSFLEPCYFVGFLMDGVIVLPMAVIVKEKCSCFLSFLPKAPHWTCTAEPVWSLSWYKRLTPWKYFLLPEVSWKFQPVSAKWKSYMTWVECISIKYLKAGFWKWQENLPSNDKTLHSFCQTNGMGSLTRHCSLC